MNMHWQKLGIVYAPDGTHEWASSHAMIPTPLIIDKNRIRVFVTFCDDKGLGRPGYVDVDATEPTRVVKVSDAPLMDVGIPGTFDENGVVACSVVDVNGRLYMYYAGFEQGTKIRYRILTGLAFSDDGGESFSRLQRNPVLERSDKELFFRCGPYVRYENNCFKMWYVGGSDWTEINEKKMPVYDIRYIESSDGINWPDEGKILIEISEPDEHGFGRPYVVKESDKSYIMHYSVRRKSYAAYRLGMARSQNELDWVRADKDLNLDVSLEGFDSDAIMYSAPITVNNQTYLFYNGNEFGRDGFAVAKLLNE